MRFHKTMLSLFVVMLLSLQGCALFAGAAAGGVAGAAVADDDDDDGD